MSDSAPPQHDLRAWAAFLEARIKEELAGISPAAGDGWWELTEPDARRFGVQTAGGRVFAPILTGHGHFADQAAALHIVRNQPMRTLDDLNGKLMLCQLLTDSVAEGAANTAALLQIVRQFAAPFIDHPEHPEYVEPEDA